MKQKKEIIYLKVKVKITHDELDPESRINAVKIACDIATSTSVMGYPVSVNPVKVKVKEKEIKMQNKVKKGDKVITDFLKNKERVVRTVISIKRNAKYESGYCVSVDGGEICKCCNIKPSNEILNIDSGWVTKVI